MEILEKQGLFSFSEVNTGRQYEMDFAKTIAIVLMVFCHTGLYFTVPESKANWFFDLIGGELCAPVFMFCMGVSFCYSRNNDPKKIMRRGMSIFLSGYILNFFRGVLPVLVGVLAGRFTLEGVTDAWYLIAPYLLPVDILQFAGLATFLIGVLKYREIHPVKQGLLAFLFLVISDALAGSATGNLLADHILGLFYPVNGLSYFPLFTWFLFPAAGLLFGELLKRCRDRRGLYRSLIGVSGLITLYVFYMSATSHAYYTNDMYYALGTKPAVLTLFVAFFMLSVGHFTGKYIPEKVNHLISDVSSYVNEIYILSWLMIVWSYVVKECVTESGIPLAFTCVWMVIILVVSYLLAGKYRQAKKSLLKK